MDMEYAEKICEEWHKTALTIAMKDCRAIYEKFRSSSLCRKEDRRKKIKHLGIAPKAYKSV